MPGDDDLSPVLAGPRADVDDPVRRLDGVLVVLDDDQGVAEVAQPDEGLDEPVVVPLVQPDRGLVEDIEHADEARPDLGGEPDPLGLSAGERRGRSVEAEVVEADVEQEPQPLVDLLEHALRDLRLTGRQLEVAQEVGALADRQGGDRGDGLAAEGHGQRDRLEPGPLACGARHLAHEALEALAAGVRLRLGVPALDVRDHAFVRRVVGALAPVAVLVADVDLPLEAVEQRLAHLGRQAGPRHVHAKAHGVAQRLDEPTEVVAGRRRGPRREGSVVEAAGRVGDDELGVDLHAGAEAGAVRAGAERAVERERAGLELLEREVVIGAVEVLGVLPLAVRVVLGQVDELQGDQATTESERRLDGVGEPSLGGLLDLQAVDDHLDRVLLLLLQRGRLGEGVDDPVDARAAVALGLQVPEQLGVFALALADDRSQDLELGALLELEDPVDDRLGALPSDQSAAHRTVRTPGPGVEQPQVVIDLGDRPDGRPRVAGGGLLVDGDRRAEALDEVDVGLVHLAQELAGVGATATRRSGAGPRRRSCRRPGWTCRTPRGR